MAVQLRGDSITNIWRVPKKGTLRGLPVYEVPDDAIWDGRNVVIRQGGLEPRPGLVAFDTQTLAGRPTGALNATALAVGAFQDDAFQNDAFQVSGNNLPATLVMVGTTTKIYTYVAGWKDLTDTPLTAEPSQLARWTAIEIGGVIQTLHTNGRDVPRKWNGADATVSVMTGWPTFTDWTTLSDRIIGVIPPYKVQWGENLDVTTAPAALNARVLADTVDPVVAIRALSSNRGVVYKTRSLWLVTAQGGSSARYFHFEPRGFFEGPAGPGAVVELDGLHTYMTNTGRIGLFDGFSHLWVVDGTQPIVQSELDDSYATRIFGVYNPRQREVYFYYPRKGDNGECKGLVVLILPRPNDGIPQPIAFVGTLGFPVSAAVDLRQFDNSVLVFGSSTSKSYAVAEKVDDAGTPIEGFWQTGLLPAPSLDPYRIEAIETLALRGERNGTLTLKPVSSDLLEDEGGTTGPPVMVDLSVRQPRDPKGVDVRGQLFGLRYEFKTPVTLRWFGSRLAARKVQGF